MYPIGEVFAANIIESTSNDRSRDNKPRDKLEREAAQVAPPRISENFRAPVNDVSESIICMIVCRLTDYPFRQPTEDAKSGRYILCDDWLIMVLLHKLLLILSKINVTRQATGLFSNLRVAGT